ncbi:unnamed protein product, partial [Staurois parvus]
NHHWVFNFLLNQKQLNFVLKNNFFFVFVIKFCK